MPSLGTKLLFKLIYPSVPQIDVSPPIYALLEYKLGIDAERAVILFFTFTSPPNSAPYP